jgi:hypothetical protein
VVIFVVLALHLLTSTYLGFTEVRRTCVQANELQNRIADPSALPKARTRAYTWYRANNERPVAVHTLLLGRGTRNRWSLSQARTRACDCMP